MVLPMKISCIVDNRAGFKSDLYAEHGFSLLVEGENQNIMMDTGKTATVLKYNMDLLGIESVDNVIISHGHKDHTGGVSILKDMGAQFFIHPETLTPKYALDSAKPRYIGFPKDIPPETLKLNYVTETTQIKPKMWIFNHTENYCDFETIPDYMVIKKDGKFLKDKFKDELNLVIKTDTGLVVLSGCAHQGMVNILYSAKDYFQDEIYAVIGGSHLAQSTPQRIEKTVEEFKKIKPEIIALGHCTGFEALCRFTREFKDKFIPLESGAEIMALNDRK